MTLKELEHVGELAVQNIIGSIFVALAAADEISVWVAAGVGVSVIIFNFYRIRNMITDRKIKKVTLKREEWELRKEQLEYEKLQKEKELIEQEINNKAS
jgi:hypothetical protein